MTLYSNSTGTDTVRNAFYLYTKKPCSALLASPFFSYDSLIDELITGRCDVRLIVRLGVSTSPDSLKRLEKKRGIQIRYFTFSEISLKTLHFWSTNGSRWLG